MIPDREKILTVRSDILNESQRAWAAAIGILEPGECFRPIKVEIALIDQVLLDETLDKRPVDFFTKQLFQATGLTGISEKGCFTRLYYAMLNCESLEFNRKRGYIHIPTIRHLLRFSAEQVLGIPSMGRKSLDVMDRMLAICNLFRDEKRKQQEP